MKNYVMIQNKMKEKTIGVEIEMCGITREKAARIVASYFNRENTVGYAGTVYQTWFCKDDKGREWKFMRDSSIIADDRFKTEMVTPILKYDDIEDLQNIVRLLRKAGAISNPKHGCGVHIHIGANEFTAPKLRNLVNIMKSKEKLIAKAINVSENRVNQWCKVVDQRFFENLNAVKPKDLRTLESIWYGGESQRYAHYSQTRYRMLNLHAFFSKGTIEFRMFQFDDRTAEKKGGLHAGQLKAYIQFCLALVQRALDTTKASSKEPQYENEKFAMRAWLKNLGLVGEEFATCRLHMCHRLAGNSTWRSGIPHVTQRVNTAVYA